MKRKEEEAGLGGAEKSRKQRGKKSGKRRRKKGRRGLKRLIG